MVSEAGVQSRIKLEAARAGFILWRNNSGAFIDKTGRLVRTGLGNDSAAINRVWKSADLIGLGPNGRFVAIEVKQSDWKKPENDRDRAQENFLRNVRDHGGIAAFCTSVDDYFEALLRG